MGRVWGRMWSRAIPLFYDARDLVATTFYHVTVWRLFPTVVVLRDHEHEFFYVLPLDLTWDLEGTFV